MIIGGIRKTSLIDYPGKVSCVVFTSGCNFHCPFCHNPDLVSENPASSSIREEALFAFLQERKGFLDGVVISGGEPTIQDDLLEFCRRLKTIGFSVKIDTNGSRPRVLEKILKEGLADFVAMDIKTDPLQYAPGIRDDAQAHDIFESIRLTMASPVPYEFRTTCVKPFVDETIMDRISRAIEGAGQYALQNFVCENLLDPEFFTQEDPGFDDAGMARLIAIAAPRVQSCIIR